MSLVASSSPSSRIRLGKSTLLHLLGGLYAADKASADTGPASIEFDGTDLIRLSTGRLDEYRRRRVGFVFQFYHLSPELTCSRTSPSPP